MAFGSLDEEWQRFKVGDFSKQSFLMNQSVDRPNSFKTQYNRHYVNGQVERMRKEIFKKNWQKAWKHNKKFEEGKQTFKMDVNEFADMVSWECFLFDSTN